MASRKDVEAGKAHVLLYVNQSALVAGLRSAGQSLQSFGASLAKIGGGMMAMGTTLSLPFIGAIKAASDMEETMSKFGVVFGESADQVKAWSDGLAGSVGRSKQQIAAFMAGSQDLFVPLGFAADKATELSKQITSLAIDLGSFNNMADEDVMRDLQAALTGSGEVMKKYGVIVSEAAVKQELLNQGLDPKTATDQMKVQARLNIIMAGTTAAQGDAIRTAGGFANQMKALEGNIKDTAVAIGQALLPVVTPLITRASTIIKLVAGWATNNAALIKTAFLIAAGVAAAGAAFVGLGGALALAGAALSGIATILGVVFSPLTLVIGGVAAATAAFVTFTDTGRWLADSIATDMGAAFSTIRDTVGGISDALASGDIALAGKIAMTGVKSAFFEATKSMRAVWIEFVGGIVEAMATAAKAVVNALQRVQTNWLALKTGARVFGAEYNRDAELRGLEARKGTMSQRDYMVARARILEDAADKMNTANADADVALGGIDAAMGDWRSKIDDIAGSVSDWVETTPGGDDRIAELKAELAALRGTAAESAKADAAARSGPPPATTGVAGGAAAGGIGGRGGAAAVSFSAAALGALGQGGGPMQKLVRVNEDQKKLQEKQLKAQQKMAEDLAKMGALFVIS